MNLKKLLIGFAAGVLLLGNFAVSAFAASDWQLNAPRSLSFSCGGGTYNHTLETVSEDSSTGDFTGSGIYNADSFYTWDITGNISGNNLTYTLVYTGANAGYTLHGVGTVSNDGSITGTTDGNCQTFSMPIGTGTPLNKGFCKKGGWMNFGNLFKNQGDCVSYVATGGKNLPSGF